MSTHTMVDLTQTPEIVDRTEIAEESYKQSHPEDKSCHVLLRPGDRGQIWRSTHDEEASLLKSLQRVEGHVDFTEPYQYNRWTQTNMATVSPKALHRDCELENDVPSFYDEDEDEDALNSTAYAMLSFPDVDYYIRDMSLLLGRDTGIQEGFEQCDFLQVDNKTVKVQRATSSSSSDSCSESESQEDQPDLDEETQASQAGGILGPLFQDAAFEGRTEGQERFIPIHPPVDANGQMQLSSISKEHVRIFFGEDGWKIHILGRNGAFLNDKHVLPGSTWDLEHGVKIGISSLEFSFHSHNDEDDASESESDGSSDEDSSGQDLPLSNGVKNGSCKQSQSQKVARTKTKVPVDSTSKNINVNGGGRKRGDIDPKELLVEGETVARKRGPGRPPANGIMSKREMRERKKAQEQTNGPAENGTPVVNGLNSVSQLPQDGDAAKTKKASKKRKRADSKDDNNKRAGNEEDDEQEKQEAELPRSPSPKKEDYTEEQLAYPKTLTYLTIIYGILEDCKPQRLSLQEIYKAVKRKFPYYRFVVETSGWESSIRHTVAQQKYFDKVEKGEKNGKGHRYTINENNPAPNQRVKNAPAVAQPGPYRGPPYNVPPGHYRPPYYNPTNGPMPPNAMHAQANYNMPYGVHAQNNLNGARPMSGPRPPFTQQYPHPNGIHGSGPPRPLNHAPNPGFNSLPTRIPGQSVSGSQSGNQARPSNPLPNNLVAAQRANNDLAQRSPISTNTTPSVPQPVPNASSVHPPSIFSVNGTAERRQSVEKSQAVNANSLTGQTAGRGSQTPSIPPIPQSSGPNQVGSRPPDQHPPGGQSSTRPQSRPSSGAPETSHALPHPSEKDKMASDKITDLELYLAGSRPKVFANMAQHLQKPEEHALCETTCNMLMANIKKIEPYLLHQLDEPPVDDFPAVIANSKVRVFARVLCASMREGYDNKMKGLNPSGKPI
ncbi:MAG: hypothetical protein M1828_000799 [Chrysothrix sp. TS-e1954]|nr:MAG: hypothetical protein M1828_000799 [Chrysothrix sp. TS-e1954]